MDINNIDNLNEIKNTITKWFSKCVNAEEAFWLSLAIRDLTQAEVECIYELENEEK